MRYGAANDIRRKGRGWDEAGSAGTYGPGQLGRSLTSPHPAPVSFGSVGPSVELCFLSPPFDAFNLFDFLWSRAASGLF